MARSVAPGRREGGSASGAGEAGGGREGGGDREAPGSANGSIAAKTSDPAGDGPGVRRRLSLAPLWSLPAPR